jgi:DNA-binding NarL/FixJ family response regulator
MHTSLEDRITIGICETQPLVVVGLRLLTQESSMYTLLEPVRSLEEGAGLVVTSCPHLFVIDKGLGAPVVIDFLMRMRDRVPTAFVIWGSAMTEPEALRFVKAGARGVVRKTADPATILACFEAVASGGTWLEDGLFHHRHAENTRARSELTVREQQVLELVEQGLRNKEIARELGIRPGTVKIHLKHIFEKTGVRGRYGLALTGLQQRVPEMVT